MVGTGAGVAAARVRRVAIMMVSFMLKVFEELMGGFVWFGELLWRLEMCLRMWLRMKIFLLERELPMALYLCNETAER